jgi:hypothetical protein
LLLNNQGDFSRGVVASVKAAANSGSNMRGDNQYAVGDFTSGTSKAMGQYASTNKERLGGAGGASIGMIAGAALLGPIGLVAGSLLGSSAGQASMRIGKKGDNKSEGAAGTENIRSVPVTTSNHSSQEQPRDLLSEPMDYSPSRATHRNIAPPQHAFQQVGMSAENPSRMTSYPSQEHAKNTAAATVQSSHPLAPNLLEDVPVEAAPAEFITDLYSVPSYPIAAVEVISSTQPISASPSPVYQLPPPLPPPTSSQTNQSTVPQPNMYQQGTISQSPTQSSVPTMHSQQSYYQNQSPQAGYAQAGLATAPPYYQNQPPQTGYAQAGLATAPPYYQGQPPQTGYAQASVATAPHYYQNQPPQTGYAQAGVARAPVANPPPPHQMRQEQQPHNQQQGYHIGKLRKQ